MRSLALETPHRPSKGGPGSPSTRKRSGACFMRLLVADDERPARFVLRSLLEELGFAPETIAEAPGGRELVEAARATLPDCVFVDVRMPGLDGLQAIEAAAPSCPGSKWVVVSSHAEFEYARTAIRLGVTEYLLKPVRPEASLPASGGWASGRTRRRRIPYSVPCSTTSGATSTPTYRCPTRRPWQGSRQTTSRPSFTRGWAAR